MNLGLSASLLLSGMLILMIAFFNLNLNRHSNSLTLHAVSKSHMEAVQELIQHDFQKVGFNGFEAIPDPVISIDSSRFVFRAQMDQDTTSEISTITWELSSSVPTGTQNLDHRVLWRIQENSLMQDTTRITIGITRFELSYFNREGDVTTIPNEVSGIDVTVEAQPREGIADHQGTVQYPTVRWRKRVIPKNLNLNP